MQRYKPWSWFAWRRVGTYIIQPPWGSQWWDLFYLFGLCHAHDPCLGTMDPICIWLDRSPWIAQSSLYGRLLAWRSSSADLLYCSSTVGIHRPSIGYVIWTSVYCKPYLWMVWGPNQQPSIGPCIVSTCPNEWNITQNNSSSEGEQIGCRWSISIWRHNYLWLSQLAG